MAAAPPRQQFSAQYYAPAMQQPVQITSPPRSAPVDAYTAAPMPDRDLSSPATVASNEPSVSPTLFQPSQQFRGDGYEPNSTEQASHDRALHPAAGLNLSMPVNSW